MTFKSRDAVKARNKKISIKACTIKTYNKYFRYIMKLPKAF